VLPLCQKTIVDVLLRIFVSLKYMSVGHRIITVCFTLILISIPIKIIQFYSLLREKSRKK